MGSQRANSAIRELWFAWGSLLLGRAAFTPGQGGKDGPWQKETISPDGPRARVRVSYSCRRAEIRGGSWRVTMHRSEVKSQRSSAPKGWRPHFQVCSPECPEVRGREPGAPVKPQDKPGTFQRAAFLQWK